MEKQTQKSGRKEITGGTVVDYVYWRGDLSFDISPWNEIDSVIAAMISYANFGENELTFQSGQKLTLRLMLFAEEMLSMISIVTGELTASFWVERVGLQYELHLTVQTEMDRKKKRQLKASSSARKNTGSFQEKLRSAFERALASDTDDICFEMPESADRLASGEWDGYERSVLVRLADNLRIAIHGREVRMSVRKDFSAAS